MGISTHGRARSFKGAEKRISNFRIDTGDTPSFHDHTQDMLIGLSTVGGPGLLKAIPHS